MVLFTILLFLVLLTLTYIIVLKEQFNVFIIKQRFIISLIACFIIEIGRHVRFLSTNFYDSK